MSIQFIAVRFQPGKSLDTHAMKFHDIVSMTSGEIGPPEGARRGFVEIAVRIDEGEQARILRVHPHDVLAYVNKLKNDKLISSSGAGILYTAIHELLVENGWIPTSTPGPLKWRN